jgi:hypothetical protein
MTSRPGPIKYPKRNVDYTSRASDVIPTPRLPLAGSNIPDRRQLGQKRVRLDFEADTNVLANNPTFDIQSPDDSVINIDSADHIPQNYTLPPSGGNAFCQLGRVFVDRVNKIMVTYHFDSVNVKWIRFVTRLRKDLPIPTPPANQYVSSAGYTFGSRGRRYVREKTKLSVQARRQRSISNRIFRNISGQSGEGAGITGEFRPF